jgi:hypothetical protein
MPAPWPNSLFHDAQLRRVQFDWNAGTGCLELIPHRLYPDQAPIIEARGLRSASLPREHPWGPSSVVLEAHAPQPTADGRFRLVVTMQSGDELVLLADAFVMVKRPGAAAASA